MKKLLFQLFLFFPLMVIGQQSNYFIPLNLLKTYQQGTRSMHGLPGPNYWINQAHYTMDVVFDPVYSSISGQASIRYFNNSPDTLSAIVFNLYQDIYRKGNSRDWDLGMDDLHDGMQFSKMILGEESIDMQNRRAFSRQGTKLIVRPTQALLPFDSIDILTEWQVKLPQKRTVRMGKYNDRLHFVAYWYPQIAVYDDLDGWDMINYNGSVEFYNDFNDYDVTIRVPSNHGVWATGLLQEPEKVFTDEVVKRYHIALQSDSVVRIIQTADYAASKVFKDSRSLVYNFKASAVPDFSFAVGKELLWDAVSLVADQQSGRRVLAAAVYHEGAAHYEKVAEFSRKSIEYMSTEMPGIPFPYPHMTTVCSGRSGGGMESPMMAINGTPEDASANFGLTFHEIAHTYMPFFMGTNEKKYAWMDEGWATLWPHVLVDSLFPDHSYIENLIKSYENGAGNEWDVPPMTPNQLLGADYKSLRFGSYTRPAVTYYFLEQAMGEEVFKQALRYYMLAWKGKHPSPLDFIRIMELVADQDLDWFFKPWLYNYAYPDLSIRKITDDRQLVIENTGGLPLPVYLELVFTDDSKDWKIFPITVWNNGERTIVVSLPEDKHVQKIVLGSEKIPDVNKKDNLMYLID